MHPTLKDIRKFNEDYRLQKIDPVTAAQATDAQPRENVMD